MQNQPGPSQSNLNPNPQQQQQQQSQQLPDSPFDLSTFLSIPTANSMNASAGGNGNNGGGNHLPADTEDLYRQFAQGIHAQQTGMGMDAIRQQGVQGPTTNGGNGSGNGQGNNGQGGNQGQPSGHDMRRQSISGSASGHGPVNGNGNGNVGSMNGGDANGVGNSNGLGNSSSGLSPYGLDPSAFQGEVKFQMPSFLNPISSRAAYPNGAEAWSGYGMPQGMDASMFTQDFGPSSASHKPFNPMNGPGVPGNGSDKGISNRRNAQGMDGNGGMAPGSGQIDNGGMNQWDSWNFRQYAPPQYDSNPGSAMGSNSYGNQNNKINYGSGPRSAYEDNTPSGMPQQMGGGEEYDMSMPTSALLPNTAFPHSSSFASGSRMQIGTSQANGGINFDGTDINAFASSSAAATAPAAASLLASGGLGGLVNPETFSAQTPGGPNMPGLYSTSGFDMVSVLSKVAARKDPKTVLGPVDCSCSFVVADVRKFDAPIVYASPTFSQLTGYEARELLGRNCRFLQSPDAEVAKGSRRKYTDNVAVAHMKRLLQAGKECQASLINYRKGGTPFINLVTVVPITWDNSEDIVYHVGFQVDLVEQPNAILRNMRDGSYQVNYMVQNNPQPPLKPAAKPVVEPPPPTSIGISKEMLDLLSQSAQHAVITGGEEIGKHEWLKLVLSHTDDFVHVLSLKGQFQYVSPSVTRVLEYTPEELINKHISDICHPSDIVPVMRELKDATHTPTDGRQAQQIHLLFRVRRKRSGYIWLESSGRLNIDTNKGRKAMILTGRERTVPAFCWKALDDHGGLGDVEVWAKLSLEGLMLWLTGNIAEVFGAKADELIGKTFYSVLPGAEGLPPAQDGNNSASAVEKALQLSAEGLPKRGATSVRHSIVGKDGRSRDVQSTFFATGPSTAGPITPPRESPGASDDEMRSNATAIIDAPPFQILLQIKTLPSGMQKAKQVLMNPLFENVFEEMDTTRGTSWQYEVHQLKMANRKLKDEIQSVKTGYRTARPADGDDDIKKAKGKKRKLTESEPHPSTDHPTPLHQQTPGFGLAPGQLFKTWS